MRGKGYHVILGCEVEVVASQDVLPLVHILQSQLGSWQARLCADNVNIISAERIFCKRPTNVWRLPKY
jgi:hypothetical protein